MILAAQWYHTILAFFFCVLALLLIIVILLQRGKGVGLAGAFGGAGGGTAFGAKTGDVLTWVTIVGAVVLLGFAVALNYVFVPTGPGLGKVGSAPPPMQPANAPRRIEIPMNRGGAPQAPAPGTPVAPAPSPVPPPGATPESPTPPAEAPAPPPEQPAPQSPAQPEPGGA
jgi:preprotein translocase subunit SecG